MAGRRWGRVLFLLVSTCLLEDQLAMLSGAGGRREQVHAMSTGRSQSAMRVWEAVDRRSITPLKEEGPGGRRSCGCGDEKQRSWREILRNVRFKEARGGQPMHGDVRVLLRPGLRGGSNDDGDLKYVPEMMQDLSQDSHAEDSARYDRPNFDSLSVQDTKNFYMNLTRMAAMGEKIPSISSLKTANLEESMRASSHMQQTLKQEQRAEGSHTRPAKSKVKPQTDSSDSIRISEDDPEKEATLDELAKFFEDICCNEEISPEDVQVQQQGLMGYYPCLAQESNFSNAVAVVHTSEEIRGLLQRQVNRNVSLKAPPNHHVREYEVFQDKSGPVAYDLSSAISAAMNCSREEYVDLTFTEHGTHGMVDVEDGLHDLESRLALVPIGFTLSVKGQSRSAVVNGSWSLQEGTNGTIQSVRCQYYPYVSRHPLVDLVRSVCLPDRIAMQNQALGDACVSIWGGPWTIDECDIVTISASAIKLFRLGAAWVSDCNIRGQGNDMFELAGDGATVSMGARLIMERTSISYTGLLGGIGVRAEDGAYVTLRDCVFRDNQYAIGVTYKAMMQVFNCKMLRQETAAIWIGTVNQTYLELRNSTIKGMVFEDIVFQSRNETVRQSRRKEHWFLGTPMMFNYRPPDNDKNLPESERLYHTVGYYILRPSTFINESNEFLPHSGFIAYEDQDVPAWAHHAMDNFVFDSEGNMYFEPGVSDEDELYMAAMEDARMEAAGKELLEFEVEEGRRVRGRLNFTAERLRSVSNKYVSKQQLRGIRTWVDVYMAHQRAAEMEETGGRLEDAMFDPADQFKSQLWAWGHLRTEWDHIAKEPTAEDKALLQPTLEEVLYPKAPTEDEPPFITEKDFDLNTRSTLCPLPTPRDKKLQRKIERKMGLPLHPLEPRGQAAFARWLNQMSKQVTNMSFTELYDILDNPPSKVGTPLAEEHGEAQLGRENLEGDKAKAKSDIMEMHGTEMSVDKEESSLDPDWKPKPVRRKSTVR